MKQSPRGIKGGKHVQTWGHDPRRQRDGGPRACTARHTHARQCTPSHAPTRADGHKPQCPHAHAHTPHAHTAVASQERKRTKDRKVQHEPPCARTILAENSCPFSLRRWQESATEFCQGTPCRQARRALSRGEQEQESSSEAEGPKQRQCRDSHPVRSGANAAENPRVGRGRMHSGPWRGGGWRAHGVEGGGGGDAQMAHRGCSIPAPTHAPATEQRVACSRCCRRCRTWACGGTRVGVTLHGRAGAPFTGVQTTRAATRNKHDPAASASSRGPISSVHHGLAQAPVLSTPTPNVRWWRAPRRRHQS